MDSIKDSDPPHKDCMEQRRVLPDCVAQRVGGAPLQQLVCGHLHVAEDDMQGVAEEGSELA